MGGLPSDQPAQNHPDQFKLIAALKSSAQLDCGINIASTRDWLAANLRRHTYHGHVLPQPHVRKILTPLNRS
jgi:hypothetical protein